MVQVHRVSFLLILETSFRRVLTVKYSSSSGRIFFRWVQILEGYCDKQIGEVFANFPWKITHQTRLAGVV
jgi:hypothetical protein